jgi:hypothetical protein
LTEFEEFEDSRWTPIFTRWWRFEACADLRLNGCGAKVAGLRIWFVI